MTLTSDHMLSHAAHVHLSLNHSPAYIKSRLILLSKLRSVTHRNFPLLTWAPSHGCAVSQSGQLNDQHSQFHHVLFTCSNHAAATTEHVLQTDEDAFTSSFVSHLHRERLPIYIANTLISPIRAARPQSRVTFDLDRNNLETGHNKIFHSPAFDHLHLLPTINNHTSAHRDHGRTQG